MAFIRKVKTSSGTTAVQIAHKVGGRIVKIIHIGSVHNKEKLDILIALYDGRTTRGTFYTIKKAREMNRQIWIIEPICITSGLEFKDGYYPLATRPNSY